MAREPYDPPFAIGDRIRYTGTDFGRWADPYDPSTVEWVRSGDIGTVVKNTLGSPAYPGIDPEPLDGWSTVRYGTINDRAISYDEGEDGSPVLTMRYQLVR